MAHLKYSFGGELVDTLDCQRVESVGSKANFAWNVGGGKSDKTDAVLLWAHNVKASFFEEDSSPGENRRQKEKRNTKYEMG